MGIISMLIGLIVAFFIYNHAKERGHKAVTAFLWAAGSAVMPIILVPLYLLLGGAEKQQQRYDKDDIIDIEATVIEEEILSCPKCGQDIKEDFNVCPYCQQPLNKNGKYH